MFILFFHVKTTFLHDLHFIRVWSALTDLKVEQSNFILFACPLYVCIHSYMFVHVNTQVCEGGKNSMFTYLGVALGPWAAVPCWEAPVGGLRWVFQVGRASCPASGVVSSSFPPAPFGSCRSSLPAGGSTPPGRWCSRREGGCYGIHLNSA